MKVVLGIIPVPYVDEPGVDTGDVAQWLENKYDVMGRFWLLNQQQFADDMAESVAGIIENMMAGAPAGMDPFASAMGDIETQFHLYIANEDITQTGGNGVPTKAALDGVNHRLKLRHGPRRPSFLDTGLYENSFKAWTEGDL